MPPPYNKPDTEATTTWKGALQEEPTMQLSQLSLGRVADDNDDNTDASTAMLHMRAFAACGCRVQVDVMVLRIIARYFTSVAVIVALLCAVDVCVNRCM